MLAEDAPRKVGAARGCLCRSWSSDRLKSDVLKGATTEPRPLPNGKRFRKGRKWALRADI